MQQGGHDTAINPVIRPGGKRHDRPARTACVHGLVVGCVTRQATIRPCDTIEVRPRYGRGRARDTAQCAWLGARSQYKKNCIVAERGLRWCRDTAQQGATRPTTRQRARYDTALGECERQGPGLRHDTSVRHDTALCALLGGNGHAVGV